MVISYLEKLQKEYAQEKYNVDQECERLQLCLRENIELVKLLEETNDPSYESFTPRNINSKSKAKILELLDEQKEIQQSLGQMEILRSECDSKLKEVSDIISTARQKSTEYQKQNLELESYRDSFLKFQDEQRQIENKIENIILHNIARLINRTELCKKLIEVDTNRCKQELNEISKVLHVIMDDFSTDRD